MAPMYYLLLLLLLGHLLLWVGTLNGENHIEMEEGELLGLYEVLGSLLDEPNWAQFHPQPCTNTPWPGVECEIDEDENPPLFHITKIHIGPDITANPPCKPSAYLSQSLEKLPYLRTLSIFNCFTGSPVSLPTSLFEKLVSSLEHLTLESNPSLVGNVPPILGQALNLRALCLSQNSLEGDIPKELGGLVNLEHLDLSFNNLSGQIPEIFGGLQSLSILDLSFNRLEGQLPISSGHLHELQKLDLGSNNVEGSIPPELGHLMKLVLLDLSCNHLNGPIPSSFSSLGKNLEYFLLDHNPINSELPSFIGTLKQVRTLSFSSCGLYGPIPTSVSSLRNLTALSLDKNNLSGKVPKSLGTLSNLGDLNLSQNMLSGELTLPEEFVNRLGKRLDVGGNKGLCKLKNKPYNNMKNISSYDLHIPYCLSSDDNRRFGDQRMKQTAAMFDGKSSSRSLLCLHLLQLFSLSFVLCLCNFLL